MGTAPDPEETNVQAHHGLRSRADLNRFAADLDVFATHDEENAHWQHEIAERLEHAVERETDVREQHLRMAQRIRDWLSGNGG